MRLFRRQPEPERGPLYAAVHDALVEVRAYARSHGGDIELLEVTEDGVVRVRLRGACRACPLSAITLRDGVEAQLKMIVPAVRRVEQVR
jgi:Fe-S cluster biogenesis protein NfuA